MDQGPIGGRATGTHIDVGGLVGEEDQPITSWGGFSAGGVVVEMSERGREKNGAGFWFGSAQVQNDNRMVARWSWRGFAAAGLWAVGCGLGGFVGEFWPFGGAIPVFAAHEGPPLAVPSRMPCRDRTGRLGSRLGLAQDAACRPWGDAQGSSEEQGPFRQKPIRAPCPVTRHGSNLSSCTGQRLGKEGVVGKRGEGQAANSPSMIPLSRFRSIALTSERPTDLRLPPPLPTAAHDGEREEPTCRADRLGWPAWPCLSRVVVSVSHGENRVSRLGKKRARRERH